MSHAAAESSGAPTPLAGAPPQAFPTSCAADGRVALTIYDGGRTAIAIVPPGGGTLRRLTDGPFDESAAVFSPDGRWLALESTASGRGEVIVRSPTDARHATISRDGGAHPVWSGDGRAVYFTSGRRLMKAAFTPEGGRAGATGDRRSTAPASARSRSPARAACSSSGVPTPSRR